MNAPKFLPYLFALLMPAIARSETEQIIVSGDNDNTRELAIETFDRVSFSNSGIVFSSRRNESIVPVELSYEIFHRIAFGNTTGSVKEIESDGKLIFDSSLRQLRLTANNPEEYFVAIFNTSGIPIIQSQLDSEGILILTNLQQGTIYIAVAVTNGGDKIICKFRYN